MKIQHEHEPLVDFIVDIEEERDITVLQITDTQIIDASQKRDAKRLGPDEDTYWAKEKMEERCFGCLRRTVEKTKPDLIMITGDLVYGEFDDKGTSLCTLIDFMEDFKIPWAPVFGNHDNESQKGVDWQCEQLRNAKHCLFKQRSLTGNSNYTVGISQGGRLKRVFVMVDSNGCGAMSDATYKNGHSSPVCGFGKDQIEWYCAAVKKITESYPEAKISFAFHIQLHSFESAFIKYGFQNNEDSFTPINIDKLENKADTDFGYIGSRLKNAWDPDRIVWNGLKRLGVDSVFVGHEHCNSASVMYEGIRCQYGQKTGTYDRANYIQKDGSVAGSYLEVGAPVVGGTVIVLSKEDGAIKDAKIVLTNG